MTIIEQLHQDHLNLSRLLDVMEIKIQKLKAGEMPNYQLLCDLVEYIGQYADKFHHPREDQLYHHFAGQDEILDQQMQACEIQHADLRMLSKEVAEKVHAIMHDAVTPMQAFIERLETFVQRERAHINFEEQMIFPAINQLALPKDWEALSLALPQPEDPLFSVKQGEQYRELYKALLQE